MASKKDILNNPREFTSDEIAEAIRTGKVTMYELSKSGNLTPLMRKRIEAKLNAKPEDTASVPSETAPVVQQVQETPTPVPSSATPEPIPTPVSASVQTTAIPEPVIPEAPAPVIPEAVIPEPVISEAIISEPVIAEPIIPEPVIPEPATAQYASSASSYSQSSAYQPPYQPNAISNKGMFKRPFSFSGRIRRAEYWISYIIYWIWYFVAVVVTAVAGSASDEALGVAGIFVLVTFLPIMWFLLAQNCKRCHDRGNSGWFQIIPFYCLILLFGDSDPGDNQYGDNPKY